MNELYVLIGIVALLAMIVIGIYNGIINRQNAVERAWSDVIAQERQKNKIIPHLEDMVNKYQAFEGSLQIKITELRSSIQNLSSDSVDTEKLAIAEANTSNLIKGLNIVVENYPELKASESYNNLMREIAEQQENIGASIRIFNQNVEDFNNGIEVFPNSMVNSMLNRKRKIVPFTDPEAEKGFDYKPNFS